MRLWHLKWIDQTFVKISISIIALFLSWIIGSISISIPWVILKCWYIAIKFQTHIALGFNVFFCRVLLRFRRFTTFFRFHYCFTGLYWVLLGFTGFQRFFYRVLLRFRRFITFFRFYHRITGFLLGFNDLLTTRDSFFFFLVKKRTKLSCSRPQHLLVLLRPNFRSSSSFFCRELVTRSSDTVRTRKKCLSVICSLIRSDRAVSRSKFLMN